MSDPDDDDFDDEDDDPIVVNNDGWYGDGLDEWGCCFPNECCMPGVHLMAECHTAEMLLAYEDDGLLEPTHAQASGN